MSTGFEDQLADELKDVPEDTDLSKGGDDTPLFDGKGDDPPAVEDDTKGDPAPEDTAAEVDGPPDVESDWSVLGALENLGADPSQFESNEQAFNALVQQWDTSRRQVDEQSQVVYSLQQQIAQLQNQIAQREPEETPAETTEPAYKWQGADLPQFDYQMRALLTQDEQGNVVARPGADPQLPIQYQQYRQQREQILDDIIRKGPEAFWGGYESRVQEMVNNGVQQQINELKQTLAKEKYIDQIMPMIRDEQTGELTTYGMAHGQSLQAHQAAPSEWRAALADKDGQIAELRAQLANQTPEQPAEPRKNAKRKLRSSNTPPGTPTPKSDGDAVWNEEVGDLIPAEDFLRQRMS